MTNEERAKLWPAGEALDLAKPWLLDSDLQPVEVTPHRPEKGFRLKELYEQLDCDTVEVVRLGSSGLILIIDEEGKFKDANKVNVGATALWWQYVPAAKNRDVVLGKAIICKTELLK